MALSSKINQKESLGRFLTQSGHFRSLSKRVWFTAFMPPSNLRLSVCRLDELRIDEIWNLGNSVILAMKQPKKLYGVADIKTGAVESKRALSIIPDTLPSRHAEIVGWPGEEAKRLSLAQELAAEAQLRLIDG